MTGENVLDSKTENSVSESTPSENPMDGLISQTYGLSLMGGYK